MGLWSGCGQELLVQPERSQHPGVSHAKTSLFSLVATLGCGWMETCIMGGVTPVQPSTMRCWPGRSSSASRSWRPGSWAEALMVGSFPRQRMLESALDAGEASFTEGSLFCPTHRWPSVLVWIVAVSKPPVTWGPRMVTGNVLLEGRLWRTEGRLYSPEQHRIPHENHLFRNYTGHVYCSKTRRFKNFKLPPFKIQSLSKTHFHVYPSRQFSKEIYIYMYIL